MKKLLVSICLLGAVSAKSESVMSDYYVVVSDKFDENVKAGTCLLVGKTLDVNGNVVADGTVSNLDRSRACISDKNGTYSLLLSTRDTAVFFYHENFGEVVIWKYNFQSQHRVEINFISQEYSDIPYAVEKPVIYLYADQHTDAKLTLKHDHLTFTYPCYNEGWNVSTVANGGILNNADGKTYPYLFWEAETHDLNFKRENGTVQGTLIETKSTIAFLESSLASLGLNSTEATDFITYWGPRIMEKEYAFVQFLVDEEVDQTVAELTVEPAPESRRRVYLLFTPLDTPQVPFEFEPQTFSEFSHTGFTLLEWGGSELQFRSLIQ